LAASIQINSCIYYFCTGELFKKYQAPNKTPTNKQGNPNPEVAWTSPPATQEGRSQCYWNVGHSRICFICL